MRNQRLIEAREQRGWTQEIASEKIGVSRVAYARWEEQGITPRLWAINQASEVFKMSAEQLGFKKYRSDASASKQLTHISSIKVSEATALPALIKVGVSALTLAQQLYGYSLDELLSSAEQELRRLDMQSQQQPEMKKTRREALEFLIELPLALMGLTTIENRGASLHIEEVIPSYVTAIPACWRLYFDGNIAEVEHVLPNYLDQLSALANGCPKKNTEGFPMPHNPKKSAPRNSAPGRIQSEKVGDSAAAAPKVGGKGDFGARESDSIERAYASSATRHQDKGGGVIHSGEDGDRTSGVGGNESGPGSSSGGDVDTDIIGVGTGGSTLSESGSIEEAPGPDDVAPDDRNGKPRRGKTKRADANMRGSTVNRSGGDLSTTGSGQGTSAVTNPMARNDDSFAAEISNDEASGADNSLSDNS